MSLKIPGERKVYSINDGEATGYVYGKKWNWTPTLYHQVKSFLDDLNLNVEAKTLKPLENKCRRISSLLQVGKSFLHKKQKILTIK